MHIPAPPDRVFHALDSDDGRASFWAESAVEHDECIDFRFANGLQHRARILERRAAELFVVSYFDARLTIELFSDGIGGTDLLLTHDAIPAEQWSEVHAGWLNVLFPLKAWLAHGVDLRNHDPDRTWEHGYADQ